MTTSEGDFGGVVGTTYEESTPWWPQQRRTGGSNLVYIVLDDVGFADLGCYGSEIPTPNIDALAAGGLRFNNFHTTALCSPSRAALLTGRNHHSVGVGTVIEMSEASSGYPGYRGKITPRAATMAEVLGEAGYATFAMGKWHVMPLADATAAGPFDNWPLQRGFDHWFGFHGGLADQWHPELFIDNTTVDRPEGYGRHLSELLVDESIKSIRDLRIGSEDRPFFLNLAFGAAHWPLQVPAEYVERHRGRYDEGWDVLRSERFERQKRLGIIPDDTDLPPRNEGVRAWEDLSADDRRLFARLMEVYAGFIEHTDAQIGRLLDFLRTSGELDRTLTLVMSDNGASADGGLNGAANNRKNLDFEPESVSASLEHYDDMGGPLTQPHYPTGWAQVSNTPLRWYKKQVHGGGIRDPFVVCGPALIDDAGDVRRQFLHIIDVMPTVLDLLDIDVPTTYRGVDQMPMEGESLASALRAGGADVAAARNLQYFEEFGSRALYHDGWKAVCRHIEGRDFDDDEWELYHVDSDFSEAHDLAAEHPEKLQQLIDLWWEEARAHQVLPLDDRIYARKAAAIASRARPRSVYLPGMSRIDRFHVPDLFGRSYRITARATLDSAEDHGVLLSIGSHFGGLVMHVLDGRLILEYVYDLAERYVIESDVDLPVGVESALALDFSAGAEGAGRAMLTVDGAIVAEIFIRKTWPVPGLTGGLHCGRDGASPVSAAYEFPGEFTGQLRDVTIDLDMENGLSPEAQTAQHAEYVLMDE